MQCRDKLSCYGKEELFYFLIKNQNMGKAAKPVFYHELSKDIFTLCSPIKDSEQLVPPLPLHTIRQFYLNL
ncbi:hypothetical protein GQ457_09G005950 [Hibiscus cannabinus]